MTPRRTDVLRSALLFLAAGVLLAAAPARAQYEFPRIGLSAASDRYVTAMEVEVGVPFEIYACVFGHLPGQPLQQPLQQVAWVVHQACCGAVLDLVDVQYNPEFTHAGESPLSGMVSSVAGCVDAEGIWLATLTVRLLAPGPGEYLWAAGPYSLPVDCDGANPVFMDMPVNITVPGGTPGEDSAWGAVKARYR